MISSFGRWLRSGTRHYYVYYEQDGKVWHANVHDPSYNGDRGPEWAREQVLDYFRTLNQTREDYGDPLLSIRNILISDKRIRRLEYDWPNWLLRRLLRRCLKGQKPIFKTELKTV